MTNEMENEIEIEIKDLCLVFVEDDVNTSNSLSEQLGDFVSFKSLFATSADDFAKLSFSNKFRYVFIVDLQLSRVYGRKDGLRIIRWIKANYSHFVVIAYTAIGLRQECFDAGADFYFLKADYDDYDIHLKELSSLIESINLESETWEFREKFESDSQMRQDFANLRSKQIVRSSKNLEQFSMDNRGLSNLVVPDPEIGEIENNTQSIKNLMISPINNEGNLLSAYTYLSKKILNYPWEVNEDLWVAGSCSWRAVGVQEGKLSSELADPESSTNPESINFYTQKQDKFQPFDLLEVELSFKDDELLSVQLRVDSGDFHQWDLTNLNRVQENLSKAYNNSFANLPIHLEVLFNIMLAQKCAKEFIIEDGNKKLAIEIGNRLNPGLGKLEIQKWLYTFFCNARIKDRKELKSILGFWSKLNIDFPEVVDVFKGRLSGFENYKGRKKKVGVVELVNLFTGRKQIDYLDYSRLMENQIIEKESCFLLTSYMPKQGSFAAEIEPIDYQA